MDDFSLFLLISAISAFGIGIMAGIVFPHRRGAGLYTFLFYVAGFSLVCELMSKRGLLQSASMLEFGYTVVITLAYAILFGALTPLGYYLARWLMLRMQRRSPEKEI